MTWWPLQRKNELQVMPAGPDMDALVATTVFNDPQPQEITPEQVDQLESVMEAPMSSGGAWLLLDPDPEGSDAAWTWQPLLYSLGSAHAWWHVAEHMMMADGHDRDYKWRGPQYTKTAFPGNNMDFLPSAPCWYVNVQLIVDGGYFLNMNLSGSTPALAVCRTAIWLTELVNARGTLDLTGRVTIELASFINVVDQATF